MTLLTMSLSELNRLDTIKQLDERKLSRQEAAELIGVSVRQVQRILNRYRAEGVAGLVSRKRDRPSNRRLPGSVKELAMYLVETNYADFGPTLAQEKLSEIHQVHVSVTTLRNWMTEAGLWTSRKERNQQVHQPRHRRERFGELVQIDGSEHYWFEERGDKCTLLVYVDDATSNLLELRFVPSESTFDYFYSTRRYIDRYGKPMAFYSDKHSIFRVNQKGATTGTGMTQFGRSLHELNIDIICADTSQAKGRVERANRTLQDRLVKELRLRGISDMVAGNAFLEEFRVDFNRRFGKVPYSDVDAHRELSDHDDMDLSFSWQEERTVTKSLTVQYDRVVYLLEPNDVTAGLKRKPVTIYDFPDGTIEIRHKGLPLPFSTFDKVRQVKQSEVVPNKRLGAALKLIQENQESVAHKRSKRAPKRRGQRSMAQDRPLNPAVSG